MVSRHALVVVASIVLASCGSGAEGSGDDNGDDAGLKGVAFREPLANACPNGGVDLVQGIDTNGNGQIDDAEITGRQTVCNGAEGSDGGSCTVTQTAGGATITCDDGTSATVTNGTSTRIVSSIGCAGQLEATQLWANYSAVLLSSGDVWASGAVKGASFEVGASSFYSASQVGAATAPVTFTSDVAVTANAGWWRLALNRTSLVATIEYNDNEVTNGKLTWVWLPSACIVNNY